MNTKRIDRNLSETLAAFPYIKLGMLFGSVGRGGERRDSDSDLDLAVAGSRLLNADQKIELI